MTKLTHSIQLFWNIINLKLKSLRATKLTVFRKSYMINMLLISLINFLMIIFNINYVLKYNMVF